jgi:hypothetical protein
MVEVMDEIKGVTTAITKIDSRFWPLLDILGMALLAAGALAIMFSKTNNISAAWFCVGAGIALIIIASIAIAFQGHKLRGRFLRFQKFDNARTEAREVPNDLEDGYLIDYTAEPGNVAVWNDKDNDKRSEEDPMKKKKRFKYF